MTRIEDMSEMERQSWITLLADGLVFTYFLKQTTSGLSLRLVHTDMAEFGQIILGVVGVTIIVHAVIASIFETRKRKEPYDKDERDIQIERKGAHWGYRLMQYGVGAVIVIMLMHSALGDAYVPPISISKTSEIIFALMVVSYVADLVKHGIMILSYRT